MRQITSNTPQRQKFHVKGPQADHFALFTSSPQICWSSLYQAQNFIEQELPSRSNSELRYQQTACKCRGCSDHHASSLPINFMLLYLDTRLFIDLLIWGIHLNDCYLHRPLRLHQSLVDLNWRSSHRQGTGSMAGSRQFKVWSHSILRKKHRLVLWKLSSSSLGRIEL